MQQPAIAEVRIVHLTKLQQPKEYTLTLPQDLQLKEIAEYLFSEWKLLNKPKGSFKYREGDASNIDENTLIKDLKKDARQGILVFFAEQQNQQQGGGGCCIIF